MTTSDRAHVATAAAAIILSGVVAACAVRITHSLGDTLDSADAALATVNRPCSPGPCGTLADLDKAVIKSGDAVVTTQMQEQQIAPAIEATLRSLQTIGPQATGTLSAVSQTAQAATTSIRTLSDGMTPVLASAHATLGDADAAIEGMQPTEAQATRSMADLDALIRDPAIPEALKSVQETTANLDATTSDFQKKFHQFLFPAPCKTLGCKIGRAWPYIKGGAEMVEPLYWGQQLIQDRLP